MPDISDTNVGQNATTSNQGSNKMPKFKAKSFFFLEDNAFTQLHAKAFGVISENEFRTTSLINIGANKKIFSICRGQIFIQPNSDDPTNKVNLILKPYTQPINGLSVKYFIYRGLPKNQFVTVNGDVVPTGMNGFITHIRKEFDSFYNQLTSETPPTFIAKFIGYPEANDTTQIASQLIDSYFYKISSSYDGDDNNLIDPDKNFEFPMIPAGMHLATASGEIGLDIVLNQGDYYIENDTNPFRLDLTFARLGEHKLNVTTISNVYQQKLLREAATLFIDPAAYYGLHANGGKIYKFGVTQAIETPAAIYTLITPFVTKNNIYLYVQSNRQRSYNFYNKYVVSDTNFNNMKIGTAKANLAETTFETNKWPVKVFNIVPVSGSTQQTIALQFTTDKSLNTSLYGDTANIITANSEGFVDAKDLIPQPDANDVVSNFTKTILLSSPVVNNANIASFIQLIYLGKNIILSKPGIDDGDPATPAADPILFTTKYMDDVFDLIDGTSFLQADKIYHVHSYKPNLYNQQEIDKNRKRVVAFTQRTQNTIAISDNENLTLFTYLAIVENEQSSHSNTLPNISTNKEATGYTVQNVSEFYTLPNLPGNEFVEMRSFTDSGQTINGLKLKTQDNSLPTTILIGITALENDILKTLMNSTKNPKLYLDPVFEDKNVFVSPENVKYKKFKLGILIDKPDFNNEFLLPPEINLIYVYTVDDLLFYSKNYVNNIKIELVKKYPVQSINIE